MSNTTPTPAKACMNCAYVLHSDSSTTSLRCGYSYFQQPPATRVQERMDHYDEVKAANWCSHWSVKAEGILSKKITNTPD
jgi:hypothetical protein